MNETYAALRAFERERWARQADVLRAWLSALPEIAPRGDALRQAFAGQDDPDAALAQMRFDLERDLTRLQAALDGRTPTAVDRATDYGGPLGLARHEAVHTLDNAAVFLGKATRAQSVTEAGEAVERAQRWIQRLRWELVDTDVEAELPLDFSARAAEDPRHVPALAAEVAFGLQQLRARLG